MRRAFKVPLRPDAPHSPSLGDSSVFSTPANRAPHSYLLMPTVFLLKCMCVSACFNPECWWECISAVVWHVHNLDRDRVCVFTEIDFFKLHLLHPVWSRANCDEGFQRHTQTNHDDSSLTPRLNPNILRKQHFCKCLALFKLVFLC